MVVHVLYREFLAHSDFSHNGNRWRTQMRVSQTPRKDKGHPSAEEKEILCRFAHFELLPLELPFTKRSVASKKHTVSYQIRGLGFSSHDFSAHACDVPFIASTYPVLYNLRAAGVAQC